MYLYDSVYIFGILVVTNPFFSKTRAAQSGNSIWRSSGKSSEPSDGSKNPIKKEDNF